MRPSGNSSASWCVRCSFLFSCWKIAVAYLSVSASQPTTSGVMPRSDIAQSAQLTGCAV